MEYLSYAPDAPSRTEIDQAMQRTESAWRSLTGDMSRTILAASDDVPAAIDPDERG
jgi:hypothetical protein